MQTEIFVAYLITRSAAHRRESRACSFHPIIRSNWISAPRSVFTTKETGFLMTVSNVPRHSFAVKTPRRALGIDEAVAYGWLFHVGQKVSLEKPP